MHWVDFSRFSVCDKGQPNKGRTWQESVVPKKSMAAQGWAMVVKVQPRSEVPTTLGWSFKNRRAVMAKAKPCPMEKGGW